MLTRDFSANEGRGYCRQVATEAPLTDVGVHGEGGHRGQSDLGAVRRPQGRWASGNNENSKILILLYIIAEGSSGLYKLQKGLREVTFRLAWQVDAQRLGTLGRARERSHKRKGGRLARSGDIVA